MSIDVESSISSFHNLGYTTVQFPMSVRSTVPSEVLSVIIVFLGVSFHFDQKQRNLPTEFRQLASACFVQIWRLFVGFLYCLVG